MPIGDSRVRASLQKSCDRHTTVSAGCPVERSVAKIVEGVDFCSVFQKKRHHLYVAGMCCKMKRSVAAIVSSVHQCLRPEEDVHMASVPFGGGIVKR
mmetsp:Transcript_24371/g.56428  ORF Transcript_24371/g.56428 Transcript_24371/m.56428 type:complete len:97 (-) Transcript_24371:211-501(-)